MSVSEKVAYLRGLMEGLDIDEEKKEGKLFAAVVDTLDEIASSLSDLEEDTVDLGDYVEELDEDLGTLEEFVYEDDCDCCCDDDDCDCCCDDDCECIEFTCPACGEDIVVDLDCLEDNGDEADFTCPACGEKIEFEIEEEDEEEDEDK